jgi:hypothetical protein
MNAEKFIRRFSSNTTTHGRDRFEALQQLYEKYRACPPPAATAVSAAQERGALSQNRERCPFRVQ